jgi:hypothetical protein
MLFYTLPHRVLRFGPRQGLFQDRSQVGPHGLDCVCSLATAGCSDQIRRTLVDGCCKGLPGEGDEFRLPLGSPDFVLLFIQLVAGCCNEGSQNVLELGRGIIGPTVPESMLHV